MSARACLPPAGAPKGSPRQAVGNRFSGCRPKPWPTTTVSRRNPRSTGPEDHPKRQLKILYRLSCRCRLSPGLHGNVLRCNRSRASRHSRLSGSPSDRRMIVGGRSAGRGAFRAEAGGVYPGGEAGGADPPDP